MRGENYKQNLKCQVRLDRLAFVSWRKRGRPIPKVKCFRTVRNIRLRRRGKPLVYGRVCEMRSETSDTIAFWQYAPQVGWAKDVRITLVADDQTGVRARDAWAFFKHCRFLKLSLFEVAFDFDPASGVDADFVKQHALFGKSRFRSDRGGPGQLRFGSRSSGKLVRCYPKDSVNAFRVEIELHSSVLPKLRRNNFREIIDARWPEIADAGFSILPRHCKFVEFRFIALGRHLRRRFGERGDVVLDRTRALAAESLHSALAYLRRKEIKNPHRFLKPMRQINDVLERAVDEWSRDFLRPVSELDGMQSETGGHKRAELKFRERER